MARAVVSAVLVATAAWSGLPGNGRAATVISTNWSGYATTGKSFSGVSGGWVQPAASCDAHASGATAASFWVGLGGAVAASNKIEQIGTDSVCKPDGMIREYAWYQVWPAPAVTVGIDVSAGDAVWAKVSVRDGTVVFELRNTTTGKTFSRTLRATAPDTSSAEWIAEAPSSSARGGRTLPVANFGRVTFSSATATSSSGHTGTISDPTWRSGMNRQSIEQKVVRIVPSDLSRDGGRFSLSWNQAL